MTAENQTSTSITAASPTKSGKIIKQELTSDSELKQSNTGKDDDEENTSDDDDNVSSILNTCKSSLFTKQPKRQWPWLIDNRLEEEDDDEAEDKTIESTNNTE